MVAFCSSPKSLGRFFRRGKPADVDRLNGILERCGAAGALDLRALGALAATAKGVDAGEEAWCAEARQRWGSFVRSGSFGSWRRLVEYGERELAPLFKASGGPEKALVALSRRAALPARVRHAVLADCLRAARGHRPGRAIALYVMSDVVGALELPGVASEGRPYACAPTREAVRAVTAAFAPSPALECPEAALRAYLKALPFLPVASGRGADRLIRAIANQQGADSAWGADGVYIMIYALIMLNTDLHNPRVRPKISEDDFVRSLRGTQIPDGLLPDSRARAYYASIKNHPLATEAEEKPRPADLEDLAFWAWMDRFCQVLPFVVVVLAYTLNAYAHYLGFGPRRA